MGPGHLWASFNPFPGNCLALLEAGYVQEQLNTAPETFPCWMDDDAWVYVKSHNVENARKMWPGDITCEAYDSSDII